MPKVEEEKIKKPNITSKLQKMVKDRKVPNIVTEMGTEKQKRSKTYFSDDDF